MRLKILLLAVVLAMGGGALYMLQGKQQAPKSKTPGFQVATAAPASIARTIRLTGQTSARRYANINAPRPRLADSNRLVLLTLIKAGTFVRKGEQIATIDGQFTADHIDDVIDLVKQADADVLKRKAEQAIEWETLQQTLRQAKSDMEKARLDAKPVEILTQIERDLLELNVQQTAARYTELLKSVAEQKQSFEAEIRILEITAARQRRHLTRHQADLKKFTIRAPIDGLTVMQPIWRGGDMGQVDQGDQLGPGQLFMKVVDPKSMQVEASANQVEATDLRVGQHVKVRFDAFPDLELPGSIYSIGALATGSWMQNYYIRNVAVNITLAGYDSRVIPDLSASADVTIESVDNVLAIPVSAVENRDGRAFVQVNDGGRFVERQVTPGIHNESQVAVLSGLQAGDQVRVD